MTFRCAACALLLDDGVDYQECPRCGGPVDRVHAAPSPPRTEMPTVAAMARGMMWVLIAMQAVFAVIWPHDFPYLRPLLLIVQLAALAGSIVLIAAMPVMRALIDVRTRIRHGLEHATIAVIQERGARVSRGMTYTRSFDLVLRGDRDLTVADVRDAATTAIDRVAAGERELVYSPQCGTSQVIGILVTCVTVAIVGIIAAIHDVPSGYTFAGTTIALALARRAAVPLGLWAQRAWTVEAHFASATVRDVAREVGATGEWVQFEVVVDVEPVKSVIAEPV